MARPSNSIIEAARQALQKALRAQAERGSPDPVAHVIRVPFFAADDLDGDEEDWDEEDWDEEDWDEEDWDEEEDGEPTWVVGDDPANEALRLDRWILSPAHLLAGGRATVPPLFRTLGSLQAIDTALDQLNIAALRAVGKARGWKLGGQQRAEVKERLLEHYRAAEADPVAASAGLSDEERRFVGLVRALQISELSALKAALNAVAGDAGTASVYRGLLNQAIDGGLALPRGSALLYPIGFYRAAPADETLLPPADATGLKVTLAPDPLRSLAAVATLLEAKDEPLEMANPLAEEDRPVHWAPGHPIQYLRSAGQEARLPIVGSNFTERPRRRLRRALGLGRDSQAELLLLLGAILSMDVDLPADAVVAASTTTGTGLGTALVALVLRLDAPSLNLALRSTWLGLPYGVFDEWSWACAEDPAATFRLTCVPAWSTSTQAWQVDMLQRRQQLCTLVLSRLAAVFPNDRWTDMAAFMGLFEKVDAPWILGGFDPRRPGAAFGKGQGSWEQAGAPVLRTLIEGPLHALGLVDLARDGAGRVMALRLSAMGREATSGTVAAAPTAGPRAAARWPEADCVQLPAALDQLPLFNALQLCFRLDRWSEDRVSLRLDAEAAADTFRAGGRPESIAAAIAAKGLALPAAVQAKLGVWWERWGQWVLRSGWSLLSFADEAAARELMAPHLAELLVCRLSERHWLLSPEVEGMVLDRLRRGGSRPMVLDPPKAEDRGRPGGER